MLTASFLITGLLLVVLQTTVFMITPLSMAAPDFYYILVAYLGYRMDILRGLAILLPVSCLLDVYSGTIIGMYPAICLSGFFLLKFLAIKMPVRKSLYQVPLIAVSYIVVCWLLHMALDVIQPDTLVRWSWPLMLLRAGLIILFSYPLFQFFELLNRCFRARISSFKLLRSRTGNTFRS